MATFNENLDRLINAHRATKLELGIAKEEIVSLKQQLADAIAAQAADNTEHQKAAEEAAAKLEQELADLDTGEADAAATALAESVAELVPLDTPVEPTELVEEIAIEVAV